MSQTHGPRISAARQVAVELAGDVAFEEADDLDGHESGGFACHAGD